MVGHGTTGMLGEGEPTPIRGLLLDHLGLIEWLDGIHVDMNHLKSGEVK
jgi:hypothetical protein